MLSDCGVHIHIAFLSDRVHRGNLNHGAGLNLDDVSIVEPLRFGRRAPAFCPLLLAIRQFVGNLSYQAIGLAL